MDNSVITNILTRRSIRKYTSQQLPDNILEQILTCAINAPSALNCQPWQVRVIQNMDVLTSINNIFIEWAKDKQLKGSASHVNEKDFSVFHNATTLIIVAADKYNKYSNGDCGMLTQNILLVANSLNIGSCVIGNVAHIINKNINLKNRLILDENYEVMFGIAMGYKDEEPISKPRDKEKVQWIK